LFVLFQGMQSK